MPAGYFTPERIAALRRDGASWTEADVIAAANVGPARSSG